MSTEPGQDVGLAVSQALDVISYVGWEVLGAAGVAVAIVQPLEQVRQDTLAKVCGWYSSTGFSRHGHRLHLAPEIPRATLTAVHLEERPDGSIRLSPAVGEPMPKRIGDSAAVLHDVSADHVGIVVLAIGATRSPREGLARFLAALLDVAGNEVIAEQGNGRQRLRVGLQEREEERRRWARELHDETLQQMGALQVLLTSALRRADFTAGRPGGVVEALQTAISMVSRQITGLRQLITELRPATLDELGLSAPLHALAQRTEELSGLHVEVDVHLRYSDGQVSTRLLPDVEVAVYRVVQEALTNASRHSGGTRAWVSVREEGDEVRVEVCDDGKGIHRVDAAPGFGITGMKERALLAGGRLEVLPGTANTHVPDQNGTVIRLIVPATHRPPQAT